MANFSESAHDFIGLLRARRIQPTVILDIGSRDAMQAIEFHHAFPDADIYAFEAHPTSAAVSRQNSGQYSRIQIVEGAVHAVDGEELPFFPVVAASGWPGHPGTNEGASSLFLAINGAYGERYEQTEIVVRSLRIDCWAARLGICRSEVVWMDLQGAELLALQGMGDLLGTVLAIKVEITKRPMYYNQAIYDEVHDFLQDHGFRQACYEECCPGWWGDAVYLSNQVK